MNTYETDIHAWSLEQINLLKKGDFKHLDVDHLIEEIEAVGNSSGDAAFSHMVVIILHILKKRYSHDYILDHNKNQWDNTIENAQVNLNSLLYKHPALNKNIKNEVEKANRIAAKQAGKLDHLKRNDFDYIYLDEILGEDCD
jgi:uncharacterized protein DUF29